MTKPKHTSGPWRFDGDAVINAKGFIVADKGNTNWQHNAHLIAAAPDMYDAHGENARVLEYLVNELQGIAPAGKLAALELCRERSRQAASKAEGKT